MTNKLPALGPNIIGATGGSGSRVAARIVSQGGMFIGSHLNESEDALNIATYFDRWINPFIKREAAALSAEGQSAMTRELMTMLEHHLISWAGAGKPWGWKEPRSIFLLTFFHRQFPKLKFLHLVRDGRDMAFSSNQNQLRKHGSAFLSQKEMEWPQPLRSIALWSRINHLVAEYGEKNLGDGYLRVRFEDLCAQPGSTIRGIYDFFGLAGNVEEIAQKEVNPPESLGRWQTQDKKLLAELDQIGAAALQKFGYQAPKAPAPSRSSEAKAGKKIVKVSDPEQASRPRIIFVLGMHRSGTSAITRGLKAVGVELGDRLLTIAADNEKGFWEDADFYDLNVEILQHLGCEWHTLQPLNPSVFEREDMASYRLRAVELVRKKIDHISVFGVKDPRAARLMHFWKSVFAHLGIKIGFVIVVRHPLSVARSVKARNGFDEEKTHYLWLEHMIPSFLGSVGYPRVVVNYDSVMDHPDFQLRRIAAALNLPFDDRDENYQEFAEVFLEERLRHTRFQFEDLRIDPAVPKEVTGAYELLEKLGRDELSVDSSEVHDRFIEWEQRLQELSPALRYAVRMEHQITSQRQSLAKREVEVGELKQIVSERDSQISILNERLNQAAHEREVEVGGLNQNIARLHEQVGELKQIVSERDSQIGSLNQSMLDLNGEASRHGEWALRLESELQQARSELTAILRSKSWRITWPLREARRWINAPKAQSERYGRAALKRLKRAYGALPLSPQTLLHSESMARPEPGAQLASGASRSAIDMVSISASTQPRRLPEEYTAPVATANGESLMLPTSDAPIASVIIPVQGKTDDTIGCLRAIGDHPPKFPFEVIIVDDSPADNIALLRSKAAGIRFVTDNENLGFLHACNTGAKAAVGQYLIFLNNDAEILPNWTDELQHTLIKFPSKAGIKIAAVTMVYNEALVLPYFLRHYSYLDEIHVLYETDSTDESLEILRQAPNVIIEKGHIEGGLDDIEKINLINGAVQRIKADWVYVVDPDEFIFPPNNESPHEFLARQSFDVVRSGMYQVYRHRTDKDLDPSLPPVPQRAHGDPDLLSTEEEANRASNSVYIKPNIVRPSQGVRFAPGHHQIEGDPQASRELYIGAHWQMADPSIAIARRMERKARVSERNKALQMGWQHYDISVNKINEECERHLDDPIIDALSSFSEIGARDHTPGALSENLVIDSMEKGQGQTSPAGVVTCDVSSKRGGIINFDPLEHPICLSLPLRTVPFQSWRQHVPFAMLLVELLRPRTLVELGVHHGDSYCAFCQAVAHLRLNTSCFGVDTWEGDPHASFYGSEVLRDLVGHHDPLYGEFSHLIQSTFDEALRHFPDATIDILHIDGYHTYEAVRHDFETWLPKVSRRGVILFHDTNERQKDFGAWKVWGEIKVRYPHFEFLHGHGLGLLAVGARPPEELSWLFEADGEKAAAIRHFFFCLGERLTDKMTLSSVQNPPITGGVDTDALQAARRENDSLRAAKTELEAIQSSTAWRIARKIQVLTDTMLPPGTGRRVCAKRVVNFLNRPLSRLG